MTASEEAGRVPLRWENLRVLWGFVRPHRRVVGVGIVLGLGTTAASLASPLAVKRVLDTVGTGASMAGPVALLLALVVLSMATGLAQWVLLGRLAEHIVLDARTSLVDRFLRGRLGDVQRRTPGELVTRVTSDTVLLREAASSSAVLLVNGVVSLVGTVLLMAVLDVQLLLSTLVAIVVVGVLMGVLMPRIGAAQRRAQEAVGELGSVLEGSLRALRTVKASRAEDRQVAEVVARAQESARFSIRAVWVAAAAWAVAGGGIQLAIIAILGIGAWRVEQGGLAVSTLVAFLLYAFGIVDPITTLTQTFTQLQSGVAAAARIRETEDVRAEDVHAGRTLVAGPHPSDAGEGPPVLELRGVTLTYDGAPAPAVDGLDLVVPRRGHVALVGPSGAGKTSTFSLVLRFVDPDAGTLLLDGVPFDELSVDTVRARLGYVEQETPLLAGSVRDNLLFRHPEADEAELWSALRSVRLEATVRALPEGLDTPVTATSLSGGERQRVALARAVVRTPEVLLLDEATAQLDGLTELAIQEVIRRVAGQGAVVTIAHRLSTVVDADLIVLLEAGRVRATGTHAELLASDELYAELVAALRISTEVLGTGDAADADDDAHAADAGDASMVAAADAP
ncbi:ABC transporter ATP-binding protein [Actinotalea solisilvae]|uniref:ABC transporter ATP-binding protein n=1 Tax=Actinotalea solisilvae TaxID=2072922 RepID=UPI0018F19129|nr:ABC transporter ATP-binding protein [Actinotalea solisilvae]